jgi:hypothetical protein
MQEFILLIRAESIAITQLTGEKRQKHIEKAMEFIQSLSKTGKLKGALPLEPGGIIITGSKRMLKTTPSNPDGQNITGYFLIVAETIEEAVDVAKSDPRFEDAGWSIEVKPVLKVEGIS